MTLPAFTPEWALAMRDALNASDEYRTAAAGWEGAVAFVEDAADGASGARAVVLDLWHGSCRGARVLDPGDLDGTPFVLRAPRAVWNDVLAGRIEPIPALMLGKLKLAKGSLSALVTHVAAAREIVRTAATLTRPDSLPA